jgi:signal transduction histidine kinase
MVVVPVIVVAALEIVSDSLLDSTFPFPVDAILVVAAVGLLSALFVRVVLRRIDALNGVLERRNAELESRATTARSLHRVSVAVAALSDLDRILQVVTDNARELLGADVSVLALGGSDGALVRRGASGDPLALVVDSVPADDPFAFVRPAYAIARLSSPLQRGDETIGVLLVGARVPRSVTVDDVETLGSLANLAAVALENDRLHGRLRELAIVEERERIAREMHDGLAQVLGYVNTKSQAVEGFLAAGHPDEARSQLAELAAAARSLYVDVREAILGLRSPIAGERGLIEAIEAYAVRFAEASKLAVLVEASPASRQTALTPAVQAHVFRIVQEGLTNVRKHARAQRAAIAFAVADDRFVVRVSDDGRGLAGGIVGGGDVAGGWPQFGLAAMRERAASIGGDVAWSEAPGGGAVVELVVPVVRTP